MEEEARSHTAGETVSHYRILEKLGEGGMGEVFMAEDLHLRRTVALKFLSRDTMFDQEARRRFFLEAEAAGSLDDPNICPIFDVEETGDGTCLIAMAYCEGKSLKKMIEEGPLALGDVIAYGIQVASGLKKAHDNGIIHRDVKPANVIVSPDGRTRIVDFGLAKLRGRSRLTKVTMTPGTIEYMSPEQTRGEGVDSRTDIWSFGCLLYEMLTRQTPFRADYDQAVVYSILNSDPPPVRSMRSDVPEELERIVNKCLRKEPADRYQDTADLAAELGRLQQSPRAPEPSASDPQRKKSRLGVGLYVILTAILLGVIAMAILDLFSRENTGNHRSVAVLPFLNLTGNPAEEYFSDGITDDILTQLYKIGDMRVISRTTMAQYKGSSKTIREIGAELSAGAVLEGSVRRAGNRVRITAQLIDASNDDHLWADTYDRDLKDIFSVQTEIAQNIAAAMHARLSVQEESRLEDRAPVNIEAYMLILEGGHHFARGGRRDVELAIEKYQQALTIDPMNARAWAQLATCYARQGDTGALSADEAYEKAREAAERALSLDDELAQGHTIMGWIKRSYDWDWAGAEAECRRALELAPGDAAVMRNMANMEKSHGRFDKALELMKQAVAVDPRRVPLYTSLGFFSMYAGYYDDAAAAYRQAIHLNPAYPAAHTFLGLVYLLQGKPEGAISEIEGETDDGWRFYGLAQAYHAAGKPHEADAALKMLVDHYGSESAYQVAEVYAFRGEADSAFAWLERAYALRDGGLSEFKGDPFMRNIEQDSRYSEFVRKIGLPG